MNKHIFCYGKEKSQEKTFEMKDRYDGNNFRHENQFCAIVSQFRCECFCFNRLTMWKLRLPRFVMPSRRELIILLHLFCVLPGKLIGIDTYILFNKEVP